MKYLVYCFLSILLVLGVRWRCQKQDSGVQPVIHTEGEIKSQDLKTPPDQDQKFDLEDQEESIKFQKEQSIVNTENKVQPQVINASPVEEKSSNFEKQEKKEQFVDEGKSFSENLKNLNIPDKFNLEEIVIGDENAPHTLIVYSSFSCNHCCKFHREEFPKLKNHIDRGQVKVILRNYIDDLGALEAAILMRFFYEKSKDAITLYQNIFEKQKEWMNSKDPREFLKQIFIEAKYDQKEINSCLDTNSADYKRISAGLMKEQQRAMHVLHISSVPAFILDGEVHQGILSYEQIVEKLEIKEDH